jgi:phage gp36-like protein
MPYCVRADIETLFGVNNVTSWADLDNDQDTDSIAARITAAIVTADDFIDSYLRDGPYDLPLADDADTVPVLIRDISARLTGTHLYSARGTLDYNEQGEPEDRLQWHREQAIENLQRIKDRTLNLDVAAKAVQRTVPTVVKKETTTP